MSVSERRYRIDADLSDRERLAVLLALRDKRDLAAVEAERQMLAERQAVDAVYTRKVGLYHDDPVAWAHDCVIWRPGEGLTAYQAETFHAMIEHGRAAVRGPHGLGKTCMESLAVLWFALTRDAAGEDWKVPTTASVWEQLKNFLWPEIHKWAKRLRWDVIGREPFDTRRELLQWNLKLNHGAAFAISPDDPAHLEGAHAEQLLYVYDESKAVSDATFDASEGAFSTAGSGGTVAYALAVSTPGEPQGRFYDIHARRPGFTDWWARHVTVEECMAAGRVTEEWVYNRGLMWGIDSAVYKNRVLGEFASSATDGVIPLAWVEAANARWRMRYEPNGEKLGAHREPHQGTRAVLQPGEKLHTIGCDIAAGGEDKTVLALRQGNAIVELRRDGYTDDTTITADRIVAIQRAHGEPMAIVDAIGVGAGVFNDIRREHTPCAPFISSGATKRHDLSGEFGFANCLTGDARVLPIGELRRVYRARHNGPLVRVQMASGDEFTATPNHRVLAPSGWVAVHALSVGDDLVSAEGRDWAGPSHPHVEDVPASIGEMYRAERERGVTERVDARTVNFHGDRPVGQVDVVRVVGDLLAVHEPGREQVDQCAFVGSLVGQSPLPGQGGLGAHRVLDDGSPERHVDDPRPVAREVVALAGGDVLGSPQPVRRADVAQGHPGLGQFAPHDPLPGVKALGEGEDGLAALVAPDEIDAVKGPPPESGRLGSRPSLDPMFGEDASHDAPVDTEPGADRAFPFAADVPTDQVVSIEIIPPSRHGTIRVYTVETSTGAYRTTSVVHKNCRSWAWWNLREMLDPANGMDLALPPDDLLTGDLLAPKWREVSGARIQVESKDDIGKRLGRSTDNGDAVVYAYSRSGGSWAALYAGEPEQTEEDDDVPLPTQKPARSGGWGDVYAPSGGAAPDANAARPESPRPIQTSGYFAGSPVIEAKAQPKSGPVPTDVLVDERALNRPCRCGNLRRDHSGDRHDGPCTDVECSCERFEPPR